MSQATRAAAFQALHRTPQPFLLPNVWDAGSARLLAPLGFAALGTTSAGVAFALGRADQGHVSRDEMLAAVGAIAGATELPVTADLEAGYADGPQDVAETVRLAIAAGVVGCNLEDGSGDPADPLVPLELMLAKLRAARAAADASGLPFVLNARTDGFWAGGNGEAVLAEAIRRGRAYAEAGADCVFIPLLREEAGIRRAVAEIPAPLNLLFLPGGPDLAGYAALGVRRLSTGGALARAALGELRRAAQALLTSGTPAALAGAIPHAEIQKLFG